MRNYLFLFLVAMAVSSCNKEAPIAQQAEPDIENLSPEKQQIVQECKEWFLKRTDETRKLASVGNRAGSQADAEIGRPEWKSPSFFQLSPKIPEFNRFPLRDYEVNYSFTKRMNPKGFRDLMLRKRGENDFIADIVEIHPDAQYLARKQKEKGLDETVDMRKLIDNTDFDGYFLIYSIDNGLRYGERRDKGVVTAKLQIPNQQAQ